MNGIGSRSASTHLGREPAAKYGNLSPVRTPERPGPGPTPKALLDALSLEVGRRVDDLLMGDHRSGFLGAGTELALIRPYAIGDDVRLIDWNATARTGEPHVRVHVAERALTAWLALDASPSMAFGTARRRKADVAEGVALAFAHLATRHGNRVGVTTFGERCSLTLPPRSNKAGMIGLLETLRREPETAEVGATSPAEAMIRLSRLARGRGLAVVVSDFRGPRDWRKPLLEMCSRHEVIAVEVQDPREQELTDVGELFLVDPETGRELRVDTASRRLRRRFAEAAAAEREDVAREIRSSGADHVVLSTARDWLRDLAGFLRHRAARRARGGAR